MDGFLHLFTDCKSEDIRRTVQCTLSPDQKHDEDGLTITGSSFNRVQERSDVLHLEYRLKCHNDSKRKRNYSKHMIYSPDRRNLVDAELQDGNVAQ